MRIIRLGEIDLGQKTFIRIIDREREVLDVAVEGLSSREIGDQLESASRPSKRTEPASTIECELTTCLIW